MKKPSTALVSSILCLGVTAPAAAQDYRFAGFDAPRGMAATANFRVPLSAEKERRKASYGFTLGYGREMAAGTLDGRTTARAVNMFDLRFSGDEAKLEHANLASVDLAHLDKYKKMNLTGGGGGTMFLLGAAAAGVGACLLIFDCFGGDDDNDD